MQHFYSWKFIENFDFLNQQTLNIIKAIAFDYNLSYRFDNPYEKPLISKDKIIFNMIGNVPYEMFGFNFLSSFCSTLGYNCEKYHIAIGLVLMAIKSCLKDKIFITSSGNSDDWEEALDKIGLYIFDVSFEIKNNEILIKESS